GVISFRWETSHQCILQVFVKPRDSWLLTFNFVTNPHSTPARVVAVEMLHRVFEWNKDRQRPGFVPSRVFTIDKMVIDPVREALVNAEPSSGPLSPELAAMREQGLADVAAGKFVDVYGKRNIAALAAHLRSVAESADPHDPVSRTAIVGLMRAAVIVE